MSKAIVVEGVSKSYRIGKDKARSLSDAFGNLFKPGEEKDAKEFWALKDISFEVSEGEAVGIIGRNGAGKSTLLKILSRITYPTSGRVTIYGRVSSLLEVGTGFHPELSGRENVYLNGTILGMRRAEVKAKFDEIVEFSGVSKFIDTPIKHYSSGMKVRLAFAVAAHLEPEILIIDEVLAVGDAEFQKKCLGKMEEVAGQGRTVLFVSHSMEAISRFCGKSIYLKDGLLTNYSNTSDVVREYLELGNTVKLDPAGVFDLNAEASSAIQIVVTKLSVFCEGQPSATFFPGCKFEMIISYIKKTFPGNLKVGIVFRDLNNVAIVGLNNQNVNGHLITKAPVSGEVKITIESLPLIKPGKYFIDVFIGNYEEDYFVSKGESFVLIEKVDVYRSGSFINEGLNQVYCPNISFTLIE